MFKNNVNINWNNPDISLLGSGDLSNPEALNFDAMNDNEPTKKSKPRKGKKLNNDSVALRKRQDYQKLDNKGQRGYK